MAHIVKLQDYETRYDRDFFHFPSHVLTIKTSEWRRIKSDFEENQYNIHIEENENEAWDFERKEKKKWRFLFRKNESEIRETLKTVPPQKHIIEISNKVESLDELKLLFKEEWYEYQIHLACRDSYREKMRFIYDCELKYFAQEFSDQYLIFYKPVVKLKEGTVELQTIIITPLEIWVVELLPVEKESVFTQYNKRYWNEKHGNETLRIVNPTISLVRTEKIIQTMMKTKDVSLPIKKIIICRNGYIDTNDMSSNFYYIDKKNYQEWFQKNSRTFVPFKNAQLRIGDIILKYASNLASTID